MQTRDQIIAELTAPGGAFELVERTVNGVPVRVYADAPESLRQLFDEATRTFAERDALVYEDERHSYAQLRRDVAALAHWLLDTGVTQGDRVAFGMRNTPQWAQTFWACQVIGAIAVPLNAWWQGEELRYGLDDSGARVAILDQERLQRLAGVGLPGSVRLVGVDADLPDQSSGADLRRILAAADDNVDLPDAHISSDAPATILYTSGTTGRPKGALHSQLNHITNIRNMALNAAVAAEVAQQSGVELPDPPPQGVALQTLPFFHIGGLSGLYGALSTGARLVTLFRWDADRALDLIAQEGVQSLAGVPTVAHQLLQRAQERGHSLDTLQGMGLGGAPVPAELIRNVGGRFAGRVQPSNGYGATETTSAVILNSGERYHAHPDSIGQPVVTADVRIDDNGRECGVDEVGEILIRGANVVAGYWQRPEASAQTFVDGWYHTGDLGRRDAEGFIYVVDRIKDMVIRGGENIYCVEVEDCLHELPEVIDVAVIGLPHDTLGEEVAAVLETQPGSTLTEADVQAFVAERLARFKVPTRVFFADAPMPRTATGKVLKRELRERLTAR